MPFRRGIATECLISAPPPSPIPTAKGSRSAANDILSSYLDTSLNVPDLSLPQPQIPIRPIPFQIDYHSLKYGDYATVDLLLRSAREFGAFRIDCRGIFVEELRSFVEDSDRIFESLEKTDIGNRERFDKDGRDQIIWSRSSGVAGMKNRLIGRHRHFSEKMENIRGKLDMIAELLGEIFVENIARLEFGKKLLGKESIFSLYRYNNNYKNDGGQCGFSDKNCKNCDYTWCLHLSPTPSQFYVRSASGLLSFEGGPDTVVAIVGQRIEEWSMGDFKCDCKEVICEPNLQRNQASLCLELKCFSLNFEPHYYHKNIHKTISLRDQLLIMLLIYFLYIVFVFRFF